MSGHGKLQFSTNSVRLFHTCAWR